MRPVLASLPLLLALSSWATAAAPPVAVKRDQLDCLFLGSDRPVLIRLHIRIDGRPYGDPWNEFMGKLFAWFDKDGDGFLSEAEASRLPVPEVLFYASIGSGASFTQTIPFAALDANKDGKVSKQELRVYYHRNGFSAINFIAQSSLAVRAEQVNDALIRRLDREGDGTLTASKVGDLYQTLRALDEDEDELITEQELLGGGGRGITTLAQNALRWNHAAQGDALVKALLSKYDRDKDGRLSRKEIGLGEAAFTRLDADEDGFLDQAELKAYLAAGEPDLVLRLELVSPTPGRGILARTGLVAPAPARSGVVVVNEKTIDPAWKKDYRRGPADSAALRLGDATMSVRVSRVTDFGGPIRNTWKETNLLSYNLKAGDKGHLTRDDLTDGTVMPLLSVFPQADKNGDGKLTRAELIEWCDLLGTTRGVRSTMLCSDHGRSLFEILDADGDGRLSLREMRTAWKRLGPLAKDGSLRPDDMPRAMRLDIMVGGQAFGPARAGGIDTAPNGAKRPVPPAWFRKMDKNGDGDISPREWLGTDEEFRAIDADGDGLISANEAIAFDQKKQKKE